MLKNKKFAKHHIAYAIIALAAFFYYAGFSNDHLNVLSVALADKWTSSQIYLGTNIGGYIVIVLYLVIGAALVKLGVKKVLIPCSLALGLSSMFLGVAGDAGNFVLYTILLCIVRCTVTALQMGFYTMCCNWYIKYRGRMMGWITIGCPLFSVVGVNLLSSLCAQGISKGYLLFGGALVVITILAAILLKDKPEDMGLYPDALDHAPVSEATEGAGDIDMSLGEVLREGKAWKLIVSYGILQAVITGMMGTMALRYVMAGSGFGAGTAPMLYLAIGAALGIPASYILGWLDDKLGSIKASIVLNLCYFICVIPFIVMPWDMTTGASPVMMLVWAFGVACMTGGCATMHPSITGYVYGRRRYQAANKWIMTVQAIIMAVVLPIMNKLYDLSMPGADHGPQPQYAQAGYIGFAVLLVVSLIVLITMIKMPDANLADREYAEKK